MNRAWPCPWRMLRQELAFILYVRVSNGTRSEYVIFFLGKSATCVQIIWSGNSGINTRSAFMINPLHGINIKQWSVAYAIQASLYPVFLLLVFCFRYFGVSFSTHFCRLTRSNHHSNFCHSYARLLTRQRGPTWIIASVRLTTRPYQQFNLRSSFNSW